MRGLRAAIGFLTILPAAPQVPTAGLSNAVAWFPVVGLVLGVAVAVLDGLLMWLGLRDGVLLLLEGVLLVALLAWLTRGLHLDGFMDTCDALAGGRDRERRLEILRDPHVGAFGVVAVVLLLLAKVSALAALPGESRLWTIVLVPCLSRWAILVVMDRFPYVRQEGLGAPFLRGGSRRSLVVGSVVALLATVILTGPVGLLMGLAAGL
ncbi:MAG: adenosylcobinamide-GDP ribazoletransferase, partial [Acidimicrobiia bacterium]|nr:adenosylcobinamide-GDP ribazoletransferase [Acidimicrobiia bacterium]